MTPVWRRVRRRVGHRGACLLVLAVVDFVYGSILICDDPIPGTVVEYIGRNWPPLPVWGTAWVVAGVILTVQAFMRDKTVGLTTAMAIKVSWALAHLFSAFDGAPRGYAGVVVWGLAVALVAIIASWQESPRLPEDE